MFRFTIHDVLWLMVVVALAVGWFVQYREATELRYKNGALEHSHSMLEAAIEIMEVREESIATGEPRIEPVYSEDDPAQ